MESNRLIAEFMWKHSIVVDVSDTKYHESWDWLMPVIDKCYQEHMSKHIAEAVMTCDIDEAYKVIVEFIKEYNS